MEKPALLRQLLADTFIDLRRHPEKLTLYIISGRIIGQKHSLSHTKLYRLRVLITDCASPMEQVTATILQWQQQNQPQKLLGGDVGKESLLFEAEILSNGLADLLYEIDISEQVMVAQNSHGALEIKSQPEPSIKDLS